MVLLVSLIFYISLSVLLALMLVWQHSKRLDLGRYISALEDALEVGGVGILIFDKAKMLKHSNALAVKYWGAFQGRASMNNLNEFISYMYDHAVESDLRITTGLMQPDVFGKTADFCEVVDVGDGYSYLVEMHTSKDTGTIVLIRDVSRMKERDKDMFALNRMNEELNLAIEASSCGVFILDPKGRGCPVTFLNRAGRAVIDEGRYEAGIGFDQFLGQLGRSDDAGMILDVVRQKESLQKQVKFVTEQGDGAWYDFRLTPVLDDIGEIDLYIGVLSDITALKTREAEFFKAQKLDSLGQLSAGLAHDFNNILSIIEGYARMIEMNINNEGKVTEYVQKIKGSSSRGAALTGKMMAFARHKVAQDSVVDLKALLEEQELLLRPLMDESIAFSITCSDDDLYGCCDADSMVQILMNFVINACDAMDQGGRLSIALSALDKGAFPKFIKEEDVEFLCLKVRDNGEGMLPDVCEKIFDPFFTTKEQGEGTGLGLSVVYGLVRDMGGYIDVCSEIGAGTEFSVYIPRSDDVPEKKTVSGDVNEVKTLSFDGYTALIVEDEGDLRDILSEVLVRRGMTVLSADHGDDALVVQDDYEQDIDVLITDLVMPGMSGVKLAEMVKSLRPDIEVVFMSGYPARGQDAKVELPDDAVFMPKPIDFDALCVNLHRVLGRDLQKAREGLR